MTNSDRLWLRVQAYRLCCPVRPAQGRMPFKGHRTMAETDKARQYRASRRQQQRQAA